MNSRQQEVYFYIRDNPLCAIRDIFKHLDYQLYHIKDTIRALHKKDLIDINYKMSNPIIKYYTIKT